MCQCQSTISISGKRSADLSSNTDSKHVIADALPALGMFLTSDHVKRGDVIYLPVPCAKAWPQTVRYVYTRRGELTEAMRQNILYLGGRV